MPGVTFDRAADYYDLTRGLREGVAERIRDAIVEYTGADFSTRFLELGVGTGRIALPFIQAGYDYTGIDLSHPMMARLENKLAATPPAPGHPPRYALLQGDIMALPFASHSFDVIIAVHVLHLVDGWRSALEEARRVLREPGFIILAHEEQRPPESGSEVERVNTRWYNILKELGVDRRNMAPGPRMDENDRDKQVEDYLRELGGRVETVSLLEYPSLPLSSRRMAQRHFERMYSSDWRLSDAVHAEAARRLQTWLDTECPNPDEESSVTSYFKAVIARWS